MDIDLSEQYDRLAAYWNCGVTAESGGVVDVTEALPPLAPSDVPASHNDLRAQLTAMRAERDKATSALADAKVRIDGLERRIIRLADTALGYYWRLNPPAEQEKPPEGVKPAVHGLLTTWAAK
jgi:hypothetical protein